MGMHIFGQGSTVRSSPSSKASRYESQARRVGLHTTAGRELMAKASEIRVSRPNRITQEYREFESLGQELAEMGKSGGISPDDFADLKASHFDAIGRSSLSSSDKSYLFDFTDKLDEIELNLDKAFGRKIKRKADKLGIKEKKQGLRRGDQLFELGEEDRWKARASRKEFEQVKADKDAAEKTLGPALITALDDPEQFVPLKELEDADKSEAIRAREEHITSYLLRNPKLYSSPTVMAAIKTRLQALGYNVDRIETRERETRTQNAQTRRVALGLGILPTKAPTPTEKAITEKIHGQEETTRRVRAAEKKLAIDKDIYGINTSKIKMTIGQLDAVTEDFESYETPESATNVIKAYRDSLVVLADTIKDATKKEALLKLIKNISINKNDYEEKDDDGDTGRTEPSTFKSSLSTLRSHLAALHGILGDEYKDSLIKTKGAYDKDEDEDEDDPVDVEEDMKPGKKTPPAPSPQLKVGDIVIWADKNSTGNYVIIKIHPDGSFDLEHTLYTEAYRAKKLKDDPDWEPPQPLNSKPGPRNTFTYHPFFNE